MVATRTSPDTATTAAWLSTRDGLRLALDRYGPADAPAVLFAHGLGQTRQSWQGSARRVADAGFHAVIADARGHGESARNPADRPYAFEQFADDLLHLAGHAPRPPVLVGASMGGLLGLLCAAEVDPPPFSALVLVDITPRWEPQGVQRILTFMRAHPEGFARLDDAADAIAAHLPHRSGRKSPEQLATLLRQGGDGRWRWHWDPRLLDEVAEQGHRYQQRLMDAARRIALPTLLVSGGRSDLVSPEIVAEFLDAVPHARHVRIADATHMVAGDRNDVFTDAVLEFLTETVPARTALRGVEP